jgi:hypothetical protein
MTIRDMLTPRSMICDRWICRVQAGGGVDAETQTHRLSGGARVYVGTDDLEDLKSTDT